MNCQRGACQRAAVAAVTCHYADGSKLAAVECAEHLQDLFDYVADLTAAADWPLLFSMYPLVAPHSARDVSYAAP